MKKIILLSVIMIGLVATNSQAQRYSINKFKYDSHQYIPEPWDAYNPALCGVASFLVPGLGQVIGGETGRGLAFFGGSVACGIVFLSGYGSLISNSMSMDGYGSSRSGGGTMLLGAAGMLAISIWSIFDAVDVAKVNSMYVRDLRKRSQLRLEMSPYIDQLSINNQLSTPVGMTMRVKF